MSVSIFSKSFQCWDHGVGSSDHSVGLAFQRDYTEVVAVEERKHVAKNVEHKHAVCILESRKWQFLFNVFAQR